MYGVSSQFSASMAYSSMIGGGMGMGMIGGGFSSVMMQRLMQLQMMMGAMIGMQSAMMMPGMMPGMMGEMGGMDAMGEMGMMAGLGQMGGMDPFGGMGGFGGMDPFGGMGLGGSMLGQSMGGIMDGSFAGAGALAGSGAFAGAGAGAFAGIDPFTGGAFAGAGAGAASFAGAGALQGGGSFAFAFSANGQAQQTSEVGAVGSFGFQNRIEKDPFGSGGTGMGGDRNSNLANSPAATLAINNIMASGVSDFDKVASDLKEKYGIEAKVDTVDGKKSIKLANGDVISDGNGNNVLDKADYDMDGATKQIKEKYGISANQFDLMYNKKLTPEEREKKIEAVQKEKEADFKNQLKEQGYKPEQIEDIMKGYQGYKGGGVAGVEIRLQGAAGGEIPARQGVERRLDAVVAVIGLPVG